MLRKITAALLSLAMIFSAFCLSFDALAEENVIDNSPLLEVLGRIESYEEEDYTPESYAPLQTLYEQYAPIAEEMDNQSEIDTAVFQLLEAASDLKAYLKLTVSSNVDGADIGVFFGDNNYTNGQHTVVFGTTVTLTAPEIEGYLFAGWMETVSKRILHESYEYSFNMTVNCSLQAFYLKNDCVSLVFGSNGGQIMSVIEKTPAQWAEYDSIDEFLPPVPYRYGFTNGRWNIQGDELDLLKSGEYAYVEPIYDELDYDIPSGLETSGSSPLLKLYYHYDSENAVGSFVMSTYLPQVISVKSIGMLFYYKKASSFNPEAFDVNINNKMLVSQYDYLYDETYITNMRKLTAKYNWAVRGYASYLVNGELKTVYSNQVNIVNTQDIHKIITLEGVEATCTEYGYTETVKCDICGTVYTAQESIEPLGHSYTETVTEPTCTEDGYITKVCTRCGETEIIRPEYNVATGEYSHPELLKTEHNYGYITVTVPATLDSVGECERTCNVCNNTDTQPYYIAEGSCADNVSYSFDHRTGTLTINGNGTMEDYSLSSDSPFYNCTNITSVIIENGVTNIGSCAFYGCSGIESISIANTVTSIGNRALYNCTSLNEATIPNSVSAIDYYAFYGCNNLNSLIFNEGNNQLTIAEYAFSNCTSLTRFTITPNIAQIGRAAFSYCTSLQSISIPSTVSLSDSVFANCTGLTQATFESGVSLIQNSSFLGCTALVTVNLPQTVYTIGSNAFKDCSSLSNITLSAPLYTIESYAFYGCSSLGQLSLPRTLTEIGNYAFSSCSSLTTELPQSLQTLGSCAFKDCTSLNNCVIPNSLTAIPSGVYSGCTALTSVTIPDSVTQINANAFYGCSSLQALFIPQNVESIADSAFIGCSALQSISVDDNNAVYDSRNGCNAIIEAAANKLILGCNYTVIPNGITTINDYAFSSCSLITSLTIPDSVTQIGKYAFKDCTSLQSINIPSGVTTIKEGLFYNCSALNSLSLSDNITAIETKALNGCTALTVFTIPDSVTSIGSYLFNGCTNLQSVTLSNSISSIPASAFSGCTSLTEIQLPSSVRSIGLRAFSSCASITEMVLSENVTTISGYAFYGCSSMTDIYIYNIGCKITSNAATIPSNARIHAYLSSTAKTYADNYGKTFVSLSS